MPNLCINLKTIHYPSFSTTILHIWILYIHRTLAKKNKNKYYFPRFSTNFGKNTLHCPGLQTWSKLPQEIKNLSYIGFKKKA